jgi:hypothetical protein
MKYLVVYLYLIFVSINNLHAQACCSAGTPLSAQMGMEFMKKGEFLSSFAYDYNFLNDQFSKSEQLGTDDRSRISQSVLVRLQYAISDKIAFGVSMPYVLRSETNNSEFTSFESLSSSGIGDLLLQSNFTLLSKGKYSFLLSGGLKMPTGSNDEKNEFGFTLPADLQPGTGSWDGIVGGLYEMSNILDGHFHFNISATARFNGKGTRFDGRQTYKFGNAFQFVTGLTYEILIKQSYIVPSINLSYRRTLTDITDGALTPSTGGDWVNIIPGLSFYFQNSFKVLASTAIPIFRYLEGTQLTTSYRFFIQVQYTLNTKRDELSGNF